MPTNQSLVPTFIDDQGDTSVNARDLHEALGVRRDFSNWIKGRIQQYEFAEGEDYLVDQNLSSPNRAKSQGEGFSPNRAKSQTGRPSIDYRLTLDMAKELSMIENSVKGRQVRRAFIQMEKEHNRLLESQAAQATQPTLDTTPRRSVLAMWRRLLSSRRAALTKALIRELEVLRRAYPDAVERDKAAEDYLVAEFLALGVLETIGQRREDRLSQTRGGLETSNEVWLAFDEARTEMRNEIRQVAGLLH